MHTHFNDNPIRPAHFYMQKVLPLVYDESLSYYEVVDKLVHKINEIGLATNKLLNDDISLWVRKNINKLFEGSFYVSDDERLVLIINPVEEFIVSETYISEDERFVLSFRYKGEICNG
ncbi:MAG: hypothetical protein J6T10_00295 [Methanobrevibacter sp.]|nr:hypothetical protein [Methanobrevibacter sp.]